jgi:ribonuclease Z
VPSFGFVFQEKPGDRKIIKDAITKYTIPIAKIQSIKRGEDFITDMGEIIRNENITIPPPMPLSYAYCSDTRYFSRLASFVKGVTVLYHEATFDCSKSDLALMTGHSTALDAATVASEAKAGALLIGHFSARYKDSDTLLAEARTIFPATYAAEDDKTYDIAGIRP